MSHDDFFADGVDEMAVLDIGADDVSEERFVLRQSEFGEATAVRKNDWF